MKLLIILAILTLGRGADVEQSDEILKELESLVASDQTTKHDEKKLELESDDKLSKEVLNKILSELEDDPVKSDDDAKLPSDDESLMDDIVTYTLERRGLKKKYNGDEVCFDRLRSCQRREGRCKNRRWKSTLRRLCSFTCGFCTPKDCRVSKYGCCNKYSKTAADGPKKEGCALKECYDVGKCDPSKCASYGEVLGKKFCPKTCGFCQRKQPAQPKCTDRGWGCCERHPNQAASGPKLGCKHVDKVRILDENYKVPPATCKNIGHGCCRTDGSVTARGPKRGCDICANTDETVCDRFRAYQKICLNPSSRHRSTYESLRRWCPRLCGVCIRS